MSSHCWGRWATLVAAIGAAMFGVASSTEGATLTVRPLTFASGPNYSMTATGTITTAGSTNTITGWNVTVSEFSRLGRYTPANTANMSYGDLSCDGSRLLVATSPDGMSDGGMLFFRSPNPLLDLGVAVADFTGINATGGQAMYMYGGAFDFLPLDQPNGAQYVAATRTSGNVYALTPIAFFGATVTGTITTDGTTGPLAPSHIVSWDIVVDAVNADLFTGSNSTLVANLVDLDPSGTALTVMNPNGYLSFRKGYPGGHLYAVTLADFSPEAPSGGQAGYYHGAFGFNVIPLNAPPGPWLVTERGTVEVPDARLGTLTVRVAPNPTATVATIEYTVAIPGRVTVELFDLNGRRLRRLLDGSQETGPHSLTVDADGLTPGVYFARVANSQGVVSSKLIVRR